VATEAERNRGAGAYSTPGVDIKPELAPSQIITSAPEVKFRFKELEPPGQLYTTRDDVIEISVANSIVGQTVSLQYRQLQIDGSIHRGFVTFTPTSDRVTNQFFFIPGEGFMLGLSLGFTGVTQKGQAFASIRLVLGSVNNVTTTQLITAGYLNGLNNLTWPVASATGYGTDFPGAVRSITGTAPGAGATNLDTVPTNARWRLHSYKLSFVTSAAPANRELALALDDGVNTLTTITAAFAQAASLSLGYQWSLGVQSLTSAVGTQHDLPMPDMFLRAGFRIQMSVNNIQAADQLSAAQFEVEEWIDF